MRVNIHTPAEVTEVSAALQAANQQLLADRQADRRAERDDLRLVRHAQSLVANPASRRATLDPWRGAVPELEPMLRARSQLLGKRFKIAGGYYKYVTPSTLQVWNAGKTNSIDVKLSIPYGYKEIVLPIGGGRLMLILADLTGSGYVVTVSKTEIRVRSSVPSQLASIFRRFLSWQDGAFFDWFEPALLEFFPPDDPDYPPVFVWFPLLKSYGFGHLVNRDANGQNPGWGWTPIIFSYLRNYRGEFHKVNGDVSMIYNAFDYKYIRDRYIPLDAPQYFITADVQISGANVDTGKTYFYFKPPAFTPTTVISGGTLGPGGYRLLPKGPAGFSTVGTPQDPAVILFPNRGEDTKEVVALDESQEGDESAQWKDFWFQAPAKGLTPMVAWDWDRPLACWIELSRLGFTPEDLMLSESEAQALAAADWDEVGFKF